MDNRGDSRADPPPPRRPVVAKMAIPPRVLSPSAEGLPEVGHDGTHAGALSARRPQPARPKPQRPNSARAATYTRRHPGASQGAMPGYGPHQGGYRGPGGTPRNCGQYCEEYGMAPPAWPAPVPVFAHWGYDPTWGGAPHAGVAGYGMWIAGMGAMRRSERPTRVVFVGEVPKGASDAAVQDAAGRFGPIRGLDASQREATGGAFVMYYDLRHAEAAARGLPTEIQRSAAGLGQGGEVSGPIGACFMLPPQGAAGMENQGSIGVAAGDMSRAELRAMFAKFGDVRDVRKSGGGPSGDWRVVEFFDTRDAERAMMDLRCRKAPKVEYCPFSGLEAAPPVPPPQGYGLDLGPYPGQYHAGDVKDPGMAGGIDGVQPVWPIGSMPAGGGYGWGPYPVAGHHTPGGYGRDGVQQGGTSGSMGGVGAGEAGGEASGYALPQTCRNDYYGGPQYVGYPAGMPAMVPYGLGGQPMMMQAQGIYDASVMGGLRAELPLSPMNRASGSDMHPWRSHRTGRGCNDRSYDPAQYEFSMDEARTKSANARTTLMIRNIPNKYSQKMLLDVLDRKYSGRYDFFYLPIDFKNRCNLGYAFVNFKTPTTTAEFYKEFHSKSWEEFNSKKVCEITYARVQGRNALIEHFRNSRFPCHEPDYLPLVFEAVDE
eukprot:evm.model.scf_1510.1 EVM.evm.TU.scf_1510.1   scf_1510:6152-11784(+)